MQAQHHPGLSADRVARAIRGFRPVSAVCARPSCMKTPAISGVQQQGPESATHAQPAGSAEMA